MQQIKKSYIDALNYLEQNPTKSFTEVSEKFHVDRHGLSEKFKKNDYQKYIFESCKPEDQEYLFYFTDRELEIAEFYRQNSDKPFRVVTEKYPDAPTKRSLRRYLDILGEDYTTGALKKYHYNRDKFKTIETEEDAYWLGFITADGCIVEGNFLQIKLASRDEEHLKKFCRFLEMPEDEIQKIIKHTFGGAYTRDNPCSYVKICSKEIMDNLKDKGIEPRKSTREKPYICNSIELEKAYIRGLIDGDGWILKAKPGIGLAGSYDICEYVTNFIDKNIIEFFNKISEKDNIYCITSESAIKATKIIRYFYQDASIYLDRKYELAQKYFK